MGAANTFKCWRNGEEQKRISKEVNKVTIIEDEQPKEACRGCVVLVSEGPPTSRDEDHPPLRTPVCAKGSRKSKRVGIEIHRYGEDSGDQEFE